MQTVSQAACFGVHIENIAIVYESGVREYRIPILAQKNEKPAGLFCTSFKKQTWVFKTT